MVVGAVEPVKRCVRRSLILLLIGFVALNLLAYHHAHSFFYYSDGDVRTPSPEQLSWGQKAQILVSGIHVPKPTSHTTPAAWRLGFQSIDIPGRDGITLSGWVIPADMSDTVAVLFHGYSSEKSGLMYEAALFHDMGCKVVLVDFPGHGGSPGNRTTLGMDEARDVAAVFEWVRTTWPDHRVVLYGHSMGGAAVMRAIAALDIKPDASVVESVFDSLLQAIRFRFELLSLPSFPAAEILLFWGGVQLGVDGFDHDVAAYAGDVRVPVLIIHGEQDRRADWKGAQRVYDGLAGRKDFLLMPEAGHVNPCISNTERWKKTVGAFINNNPHSLTLPSDKNTGTAGRESHPTNRTATNRPSF